MLPYFGYGVRESHRPFLDDEALDACELSLDHSDLVHANVPYVNIAATGLALGNAPHDGEYLKRVRAIAVEHDAVSVWGQLGTLRSGTEAGITHCAPLSWTEASLDSACRDVTQLQNYFEPAHFSVKTMAYLFRLPGEMSEAEFVSRLLTRTGCGWVLNVASVYANGVNFHFDAYEFLAEVVPATQRLQIQLDGGFFDESAGLYIDSHVHGIAEPVWDLYRFALQQGRGKVDAVFVPGEATARLARRIAEETYRPVIRV